MAPSFSLSLSLEVAEGCRTPRPASRDDHGKSLDRGHPRGMQLTSARSVYQQKRFPFPSSSSSSLFSGPPLSRFHASAPRFCPPRRRFRSSLRLNFPRYTRYARGCRALRSVISSREGGNTFFRPQPLQRDPKQPAKLALAFRGEAFSSREKGHAHNARNKPADDEWNRARVPYSQLIIHRATKII